MIVPYPPGIPLLVQGELITRPILDTLLQLLDVIPRRHGDDANTPCSAGVSSRADIVFIPVLDTSAGFAAQAVAATEDLTTPVAVVDETILECNLARMAAFAAQAGVKLRPHAKTHKSPFIAQRQIAHGAVGLTAATLREAEVFAGAGVTDLFIAHPPVGAAKRRRLAALAERGIRLAVALDDPGLADGLPAGVEVMWEVDTGLHRVGTAPGDATARAAQQLPAGRLRGLFAPTKQFGIALRVRLHRSVVF